MERGLVMVVHGVALALVAYVLMVYALKQSPSMAESRSVLLGALACSIHVCLRPRCPHHVGIKTSLI